MKKIMSLILTTLLVVAMVGCGSSPSGDSSATSGDENLGEYTVRVAHGLTTSNPVHLAFEQMKEYVEAQTDGRVIIDIFPNAQMGGERETVEAVMNGTLEMGYTTAGVLTSFVPEYMVLDIPFQFSSYEDAWMVLDSNVGIDLAKTAEQYGLYQMCWMESGFRHITTSSTPISVPSDMEGLKFRTMEAAMHMANFEALGSNPTPVAWNELYLAMSQNLVDGQENPLINIVDLKMYEVQTHLTLSKHLYDAAPFVTNLEWFEDLPVEYQMILKEGAFMAQNYNRFLNSLSEDQYRAILEEKGMQIIDLTAQEQQAFKDIGQPAVTEKVKEEIGAEFVEAWLASVAEIQAQQEFEVS